MATGTLDKTSDLPLQEVVEPKFQYPGVPTTCDGAEAVVWVETRISQGTGAFPITSSTTMGGGFNAAVMNGIPNLWGEQLVFVEPESEHSAPLYAKVSESWNTASWIHDDLPAGFDTNDFGSINTALADEFPDDRLAHAYFLRDYNFSLYSYETFYGFPPKEQIHAMWAEDTTKLIAQADSRDNLAVFIPYYRNVNCSHGTMLVEHAGTEIEALGMDIGDFIDLLLDDDRPLESFVEEVQADEDLEPAPDCEMVPESG